MKPDLTHQHYARRLLEEADLSPKERNFCEGMALVTYMTEGQEEWLMKLAERLRDE